MSDSTTLPRLLRAQEVAERLDYPLSRVYELARSGQMPVVRLGRAMRFDAGAVREWLRAGGTAAASNGDADQG